MNYKVYINGNPIKAGFDPGQLRDADGKWTNNDGHNNTDENSEEFKKWFEGSVVTKKGVPMVLYHGTPDSRELEKTGIFQGSFKDSSFFFSDNYKVANSYAKDKWPWDYQNAIPKVYSVYLQAKNPLRLDGKGKIWREFEAEIDGNLFIGTKEIIAYAKTKGYDSVIVDNIKDMYQNTEKSPNSTVYSVFKPDQIRIIR